MIITILLVIFNIFLLIFPQIVLTASRDGLLLWFNNVLPTLLPFMIATNMLISLGFAEIIAGIFAPAMKKIFNLPGDAGFGLIAGLTSGYPVGAKTVADLVRAKRLSVREAQHLIGFCNNAGPLFILGVVGVGMFGSARVGYILWAAHVMAALAVGLVLRRDFLKNKIPRNEKPREISSLRTRFSQYRENRRANTHSAAILGEAVRNSMEAILVVGGLIIFFSVVLAVLETIMQGIGISDGLFSQISAGLVEVTGGARRLSSDAPSTRSLAATAFIIGFGGFSIHAQTLHFTAGTGIRGVPYLFAKFLHGIFAAVFTIIFFNWSQIASS